MRGVDISEFQGSVNFDQLKANSSFVIIRAGYSKGNPDAQFKRNQSEARRVGIPRGYYWFTYPDRVGNSQVDADNFVDLVKPQPGEIMALDYEVNQGNVAYCRDFLIRVEQRTGIKGYLYTNQARTISLDWSGVKNAGYALWVAIFDNDPNKAVNTNGWKYLIKQYTADGRMPGIGGAVDLDEFYGNNFGGETMIQETTQEFNRFRDVFIRIRGRDPNINEFRQVAVGQSWLHVIEVLSDNPEATKAEGWQELGQKAFDENWAKQITDLQASLKITNDKLTELAAKADLTDKLQKQVDDLTAKNQALLDQNAKDTETGNSFIRWIGNLFNRGGK